MTPSEEWVGVGGKKKESLLPGKQVRFPLLNLVLFRVSQFRKNNITPLPGYDSTHLFHPTTTVTTTTEETSFGSSREILFLNLYQRPLP